MDDMTPEGLTYFAGEIAMMYVFSRALSSEEIQAAFDAITNPGIPGDFNGNSELDVDDINQLSANVRAGTNDVAFDLNGDDAVDGEDRRVWIKELRQTWIGDSNLDGEFNSSDFVLVFQAGQYEDADPLNSNWETGDWNGDGDFTSNDFVVAFQDGGFEKGPLVAAAVPEPAISAWIVALVAGAAGSRRKTALGIHPR